MGDGAAVKLAIAEEANFGVNPAADFRYMRLVNSTLKGSYGNVQSAEITQNRQPAGRTRVNTFAEGGFSCEYSLITPADAGAGKIQAGYDGVLEGVFMSDWSTIIALANKSIDISLSGGGVFTLTDAAAAASFTTAVKGQWLKLTGFNVNGTIYAHITTKTSNDVVVCEGVRSTGIAVADEAGQVDIGITGSMLRVGTTRKSYTVEKQFTDLAAPEYSLFTGMRFATLAMRYSPQQILGLDLTMMGKLLDTSAATGAGAPAAQWSTPRLNSVTNIPLRFEGAYTAPSAHRFAEIGLNIDNRLRIDTAIGEGGPVDIGLGTPVAEGNIIAFMSTGDLQRKIEDDTLTKFAWLLDDGTRQQMWSVKRARYFDGSPIDIGNDSTVKTSLQWAAEPDADNISLQVDRF